MCNKCAMWHPRLEVAISSLALSLGYNRHFVISTRNGRPTILPTTLSAILCLWLYFCQILDQKM